MRENLKEFKLGEFFTLIRRKIQRIDMIVLSFEELKILISDFVNFVHRKRNEHLATDRIHFMRSQIGSSGMSIKQISSNIIFVTCIVQN